MKKVLTFNNFNGFAVREGVGIHFCFLATASNLDWAVKALYLMILSRLTSLVLLGAGWIS
jgi:hypothetical protein